jgi:hypothetical protein
MPIVTKALFQYMTYPYDPDFPCVAEVKSKIDGKNLMDGVELQVLTSCPEDDHPQKALKLAFHVRCKESTFP